MAHAPTLAGKADISVKGNGLGTPEADARHVAGIPAAALEAAGLDPADLTEVDPVRVDSAEAAVETGSEAGAQWGAPAVADQAADARVDLVTMIDSVKTNANGPQSHQSQTLFTRTTRS